MDKIDTLWNIEQIKQLKARYCRCMDTHDYAGFADVFSQDVRWTWIDEAGSTVQDFHSRAEILTWLEALGPVSMNVHNAYIPEIEIHDDRHASGIWGVTVYSVTPGVFNFKAYGHYHEKYVKSGNGPWCISEVRVKLLRTDQVDTAQPTA